jgi:hypothetical protein
MTLFHANWYELSFVEAHVQGDISVKFSSRS